MSMDRCILCNRPVDTNDDLECYGEDGELLCTCEWCRKEYTISDLSQLPFELEE